MLQSPVLQLQSVFPFRALLGVHLRRAVDDDAGGRGQLLLQHAALRVPVAARGDARGPQGPRHVPPLHGGLPGKEEGQKSQYEHLDLMQKT